MEEEEIETFQFYVLSRYDHDLCSPGMMSAKVPEWKLKIILF